jgi:hypothetical protein
MIKNRTINIIGETKMTDEQRDENLLVVVAVEEYSRRHSIPAKDAIKLFLENDVIKLVRQCYDTLHTQDLYETVAFAEDVLKRKNA